MPTNYRLLKISINTWTLPLQIFITYVIQKETMLKSLNDNLSNESYSVSTSTETLKQKLWINKPHKTLFYRNRN